MLAQQDRERVGLFTGGTPRHPDADGVICPFTLKQAGHDDALHGLERIGVAEECGDTNQQVTKQQRGFALVLLERGDVVGQLRNSDHLHAALHSAKERLVLVLAEIVTQPGAQNFTDAEPGGVNLFNRFSCFDTLSSRCWRP